jgi:predicted permease
MVVKTFLRKVIWRTRRDRKDAELREELQFHLDEEADERRAGGLPADEARRAARLDLGNLAIVREDTRAAWTWRLLEQAAQDLRYGLRTLAANTTFSALAILSLALGIGANAAIFSFMDAILMRSLPVADPASLVTLAWHTKRPEFHGANRHDDSYRDTGGGYVGGIFAYQAFELLQRETSVFSTVFGYQNAGDLHLAITGDAQIANTEYVSGNYFSGLGVPPASGRLLGPDDDRAGAAGVAVISYGLSQSRFGGPAAAVEQPILLDTIPFTIVGVTPKEFFGADPDARPDVYVAMHANLLLQPRNKGEAPEMRYTFPEYDWVVPMARLRPGVGAAQAQATAAVAFSQWEAAINPKRPIADRPTLLVKPATGGLDSLRRTYAKPLYVLLGLVGLILAIACANIANLLLGRASARSREMAVRLSIGADRARIIRQLLTESLLLSGIGGAVGVAFAWPGIRFLTVLLANGRDDQPFGLPVTLNWRVLGAMAALSMLTGVLFGLAPAVRGTRVDLTPALKSAKGRGSLAHGGRRIGLGRVLVVAQMVFTLLILVAAGLFLRTLSNLESIQLGFDGDRVLAVEVNARQAGHIDPEIGTFYDRLTAEFGAIAGVKSVTLSRSPLMGVGNAAGGVKIPGGDIKGSRILPIGPGFFSTMGIPLLRGRAIGVGDRAGAPYVAVVNQAFVKTFFGTEDAIGRHVISLACGTCDLEIVGVAGDSLYGNLRATTFFPAGPPPILFLSFSQAIWEPVGDVWYELKTTGDPLAAAAAVRDVVKRADPHVPVIRMKTQRALIDGTINQPITFARLGTAFALLALLIACVGLYGTVSFGVARRTTEIGVRMAIGARRAAVVWMVLGDVLLLAAIGIAIGVPASLAASTIVESFLFGTKRNDPLTLAVAVLTMTAAMALAGYLPARSASRIDPMVALRYE